MQSKGTEEEKPDSLGLHEEDYLWLGTHIERRNGHAQHILAALMQMRRTLMMRDEHDAYSTNQREAGLEPMTWQEWRELDLLEQERVALRKMRADDIADLY